jgi:hypothetical protein
MDISKKLKNESRENLNYSHQTQLVKKESSTHPLAVQRKIKSMVTRFGKFSPLVRSFIFGSFFENSRSIRKFLGNFFHNKTYVLNLSRLGWVAFQAFFHKLVWSLWLGDGGCTISGLPITKTPSSFCMLCSSWHPLTSSWIPIGLPLLPLFSDWTVFKEVFNARAHPLHHALCVSYMWWTENALHSSVCH